MADFEIPENPEFSDAVRKFEEQDPGHADLFNAVVQTLLNNEVFLKKSADEQNTEMSTLKKSVADGKALVAKAVSDKGVSTAAEAAFSVFAENIRQMASHQYSAGVTAADGRSLPGSVNYQSGYNKGVTDADNRVNSNSANWKNGWDTGVAAADGRAAPGTVNYQSGYNQGVADADGRANSNSANWQNGYATGASAKHTELVNLQHSSLINGSGSFGAWVAVHDWSSTDNSCESTIAYYYQQQNAGLVKILFEVIRGNRRIFAAVGYGCSYNTSHLICGWSI